MKVDDHRLEFLNSLERAESKLLSWGLVDGSFSTDEIGELCETYLDDNDLWSKYDDEDEFQDALEEIGFLYDFQDGTRRRYRTRMAETLRLLSRLRQLFPKHMRNANRKWQTAKPLVGDFRFMLRPRTVPQRNLTADAVRTRIEQSGKLSSLQKEVLSALLARPNAETMQLATFQARAAENILGQLKDNRCSGTIVCAGTGSGKTLSFYLPAFLSIADSIDSSNWTRCLAVYPRNELLKDQLAEAYGQARKLDSLLQSAGKRKLTIATLFGDTPDAEWSLGGKNSKKSWDDVNDGFVCPFLTCPAVSCQGRMVWRNEDRNRKLHRLTCQRCGCATADDELILTRERLQSKPADILFTTTEMPLKNTKIEFSS